jgi:hypothetical protein
MTTLKPGAAMHPHPAPAVTLKEVAAWAAFGVAALWMVSCALLSFAAVA